MKVMVMKPFKDKDTGAVNYGGAVIKLCDERVIEILEALGENALVPVDEEGTIETEEAAEPEEEAAPPKAEGTAADDTAGKLAEEPEKTQRRKSKAGE